MAVRLPSQEPTPFLEGLTLDSGVHSARAGRRVSNVLPAAGVLGSPADPEAAARTKPRVAVAPATRIWN